MLPPRTPALVEIDNLYKTRAAREVFLEANGNTIRKSNFGEMWTDQAMLDLDLPGFRVAHKNPVTDIDSDLEQGIDHVFSYIDKNKVERFVIVESKYSLDGTTQTTESKLTDDGRQMSNDWILGSDRLENAVPTADGLKIEAAILNNTPIDRVLASIDIGGNVQFRNVDSNGVAILPKSWWIPDVS